MEKSKEELYNQISLNIKKYRKQAGITQAALAEKIWVSHEFIRRIESTRGAKTFSVDTLYRIAIALNISMDQLFENTIDNTEKTLQEQS